MIKSYKQKKYQTFFLLALVIFSSNLSNASERKLSQLSSAVGASAEESARSTWEPTNFTDPRRHDPNNFRYIVHAAISQKYSLEDMGAYLSKMESYSALSASIVDQTKRRTAGAVGFILEVPAENIIITRPVDIASGNFSGISDSKNFREKLSSFLKIRRQYETSQNLNTSLIRTVSDILKDTNPLDPYMYYNEILIQGKVKNGVKITGLFIQRDHEDSVKQEDILEAEVLAQKLRLPLIEINSF